MKRPNPADPAGRVKPRRPPADQSGRRRPRRSESSMPGAATAPRPGPTCRRCRPLVGSPPGCVLEVDSRSLAGPGELQPAQHHRPLLLQKPAYSTGVLAVCSVACSAASRAANGVLLREPLKPAEPALPQATVLPSVSVTVTIVLLKEAKICTCPEDSVRLIFFTPFRRVERTF